MAQKFKLVICYCRNSNPHFKGMDFWKLINEVRSTGKLEFSLLHPRLCEDDIGHKDGTKFLSEIGKLKSDSETVIVIGACDRDRQRKLFKDILSEAGVDFETEVKSVDLWDIPAEKGIERINETVGA